MEETSMDFRLLKAGIKTIRPKKKHKQSEVYLYFKGKKIQRPYVNSCVYACKKAFGLEI